MKRIKERRYGQDGDSPRALAGSHTIEIGFDARKPGADRPFPGKLPGFLICLDTRDAQGARLVDQDIMTLLGTTPEKIAAAKSTGLKSPQGLLPTSLDFVIMYDAAREAGQWHYPGTFGEEYECFTKCGRFCHGDGERATRKHLVQADEEGRTVMVPDGTSDNISCVPVGKRGAKAEEFCEYSVRKECKARSFLALCLFRQDDNGRPTPLSRRFGYNARFVFDTSSETNAERVLSELDRAADRLDGIIHHLTGTLIYCIAKKRTGDPKAPVGTVGQVMFVLSEADIARREQEMRRYRLEDRRVAALPAPVAEVEPTPPEPEEPDPFAANGEDISDVAESPPQPAAGSVNFQATPKAPPASFTVEPEKPAPAPATSEPEREPGSDDLFDAKPVAEKPAPAKPPPPSSVAAKLLQLKAMAKARAVALGTIADSYPGAGHIDQLTEANIDDAIARLRLTPIAQRVPVAK